MKKHSFPVCLHSPDSGIMKDENGVPILWEREDAVRNISESGLKCHTREMLELLVDHMLVEELVYHWNSSGDREWRPVEPPL